MSDTSGTQSGGVLSKQAIYERLSKLTPEAIEKLHDLLSSNNENIRLGAINKILDKTVASLKAVEVDGGTDEDGHRIPFTIYVNSGQGFIPATLTIPTSSAGGFAKQSPEVQGSSVAPQSTENLHSNIGSSEAGTS